MPSAKKRRAVVPLAFRIEVIALALYFIRDAFGGAMRYYTSIFHVEALWFTPDAVSVFCVGLFIQRCIIQNRSVVAVLVLLQIVLSLIIGYFFLGSFNAMLSAFKMMIPVFAGFCFCDSDIGSTNSTGLSSRIAASINPFASGGVAGTTTFRPGTWANHDT